MIETTWRKTKKNGPIPSKLFDSSGFFLMRIEYNYIILSKHISR